MPLHVNGRVLGIDPGPNPGMVMLWCRNGKLLEAYIPSDLDDALMAADVVSVEKFVLGQGTLKRTRQGSVETIAQVGYVSDWCAAHSILKLSFPAGVVKPWATDERLRSWGLYEMRGLAGTGRHHRDAARHALYSAVQRRMLPARPNQPKVIVQVR